MKIFFKKIQVHIINKIYEKVLYFFQNLLINTSNKIQIKIYFLIKIIKDLNEIIYIK